jgi:hypothetical protein
LPMVPLRIPAHVAIAATASVSHSQPSEMLEMLSPPTWHSRSAHLPVAHDVEHREMKSKKPTHRHGQGRPSHRTSTIALDSIASCLLHHPSALHIAPLSWRNLGPSAMAVAQWQTHLPTTPSPSDVSHSLVTRQSSIMPCPHRNTVLYRLPTGLVHRLAQNHRVFHRARQTPRRHALHRLPLASSCCCCCPTQARARLAKIK